MFGGYPGAVSSHYFTEDQVASQHELRAIDICERGQELRLWTADKVFSSGQLDIGTRQFLREVPHAPATGTFLDLGCGWGPMTTLLAKEAPAASVWAVDVSERAMDLARKNCERVGASNVTVMPEPEALTKAKDQDVRFDLIWSNPPVRIGKNPLRRLLSIWLERMSDDGEAYLVIGRNLGADTYARWLTELGYSVNRIASKKGFRILRVTH